jgi:membrane protein DedA with SNARE-associated domain
MFAELIETIIAFAKAHEEYLIPLVFVIAFFECLAFVSIFAPATVLFTAFGAIAGASQVGLLPLAIAAAVGSTLGYWVSYWLGIWVGPPIFQRWPLNKKPDLFEKTHAFFERWGALGILVSHFSGQIRPVAPLVAGIVRMSPMPFHLANLGGSLGWSFGLFYASGTLGRWLGHG